MPDYLPPVAGDPLREATRAFQDLRDALRQSRLASHPGYRIARTAAGQSIVPVRRQAEGPWEWTREDEQFSIKYDGTVAAVSGGTCFWWMHVAHSELGGPGWQVIARLSGMTISAPSAMAIGVVIARMPSDWGASDEFDVQFATAATLTELLGLAGQREGSLFQVIPLATINSSKEIDVYHVGAIYAGDWPAPGTCSLFFGSTPPPGWKWLEAEDGIILAAGNDAPGSIIGSPSYNHYHYLLEQGTTIYYSSGEQQAVIPSATMSVDLDLPRRMKVGLIVKL